MKIIIAPDSFKGSIAGKEAAQAIVRAVREAVPQAEILELPMADGGEGTVDAVLTARGGERITCQAEDPLGRSISAVYGWMEDERTAVVETAAASGLPLLKTGELNPAVASSFGTGQLIRDAIERGAETIILGLGGSATVDGGAGLFQALGLRLLDEQGNELGRVGGELHRIAAVDASALHPRAASIRWIVASDVTNPLLGKNGAVAVFGPQKGVTSDKLSHFEKGMQSFSEAVKKAAGRDMTEQPGSGAAGGIGFLLQSLLPLEFRSGLELMIELSRLDKELNDADLVLTGEGKIDGQSLFGKVPVGIGRAAKQAGVPVVVFAGTLGDGLSRLSEEGISAVMPIIDRPMSLEEAMEQGEALLYEAALRLMTLLELGRKLERWKD